MIKLYIRKLGTIEVKESDCSIRNFIEYSIYFRDYIDNQFEDFRFQPHHRIVKIIKHKSSWYLYYPLSTSPCTGGFKRKSDAVNWFMKNGR